MAEAGPKTLIYDIELSPNVVSTWSLFKPTIGISQIIESQRILCFAWRWAGSQRTKFSSEWDDGYSDMVATLHSLFDSADVVCGFNSANFDDKHSRAAFLKEGLAPPSPFKQLDLYREVRRQFNFPSRKLDYICQTLGLGGKVKHSGQDLWNEVLRPTTEQSGVKARNLMKKYCLTHDHKVLTTDLRWVALGSLALGDQIIGFHENVGEDCNGRRWLPATVLGNDRMVDDTYLVTLSNGDQIKCTAGHQWLTCAQGRTGGARWIETFVPKGFNNGVPGLHARDKYPHNYSSVCKYFRVTDEIMEKDAGWLAGMFDGEGHLTNRSYNGGHSGMAIGVAQKKGPELDRMYELLDRYGIDHSAQHHGKDEFARRSQGKIKSTLPIDVIRIAGGFYSSIDFLTRIRPERLISKLDWDNLPRMERRTGWTEVVQVESVEYIGKQEVVVLETSTGTFMADGYPMHNCKNDVDLTTDLYDLLYPWLAVPINAGLFTDDDDPCCPACGGSVQRRGFAFTRDLRYRRYYCGQCHRWSRGKKCDKTSEMRAA